MSEADPWKIEEPIVKPNARLWLDVIDIRQNAIRRDVRQRILVVGWTAHAQRLKEIIENDPSHPYEVVCCIRPLKVPFSNNHLRVFKGLTAIG